MQCNLSHVHIIFVYLTSVTHCFSLTAEQAIPPFDTMTRGGRIPRSLFSSIYTGDLFARHVDVVHKLLPLYITGRVVPLEPLNELTLLAVMGYLLRTRPIPIQKRIVGFRSRVPVR